MSAAPVTPIRRPSVTLRGELLHIENLTLDGQVAALAAQRAAGGEDAELTVRRMLEVGAAVLAHGQSKSTLDAVSSEVSRLVSSIGEGSERIEQARRQTLESVSAEVTRLLAGARDRHESLEAASRATVEGVAVQVDRMLAVMEERAQRAEAVRRTAQRASAKGLAFEDALSPALDACFAPHGDILEITSTVKGIAQDKVGDYVLSVNPRDSGGRERRIVFEAKDRALSMPKALAEMDAAMANRDAQVAVIVFAHADRAPLAGKPLRVLPGNRLICVWDPEDEGAELTLEIACQLARTLALAAERDDASFDRAELAQALVKLTGVIDRANAIQRGVRSARRGLDQTEEAYEQMVSDARALLGEIQDRL